MTIFEDETIHSKWCLCFSAPGPPLVPASGTGLQALNLYLLAPTLNLFLPAMALNSPFPAFRFAVKVCYSVYFYKLTVFLYRLIFEV